MRKRRERETVARAEGGMSNLGIAGCPSSWHHQTMLPADGRRASRIDYYMLACPSHRERESARARSGSRKTTTPHVSHGCWLLAPSGSRDRTSLKSASAKCPTSVPDRPDYKWWSDQEGVERDLGIAVWGQIVVKNGFF